MGTVIAKLRRGDEVKVVLDFDIGDYVKVSNTGYQYTTYDNAFKYFWGNTKTTHIETEHNGDKLNRIWKVINMVVHESSSPDYLDIICHIRSMNGENAVIGSGGLTKLHYHHRNRVRLVKIPQLPYHGDVEPHDWKDKLYEVIEDGK